MTMKFTPGVIRKNFQSIIQTMADNPDPFVTRPGRDFTRNRQCTFTKMLTAIMAMESHDIDKEILCLMGRSKSTYCRDDLVTCSAFVQARAKINEKAFLHLFREFNRKIPFSKTKNGLHMIAFDGTDTNIPAEIRQCNTFIPYNSNNGGYNQLHLNVAFHLQEQRYSDIVIQGRGDMKEAEAACEMVDRKAVRGKCLYICDRGYVNYNLMAHIVEADDYFLIRAKDVYSDKSPFKDYAPEPGDEFDVPVRFFVTRNKKKHENEPKTYKFIPNSRSFDYIEPGDKETEYLLSFRLIGIRLENGSFEYLLTNLPDQKYPKSVMKEYYHDRWEIETSFLFIKYGVALNYFHSKKMEFLTQEIYAKLIMFNFVSLLVSCAKIESPETKYKYKPSFTDAIDTARDFLLGKVLPRNVVGLLIFHKIPIRPDRKFERNVKSQRLRTLQHRS